MVWENPGAWTSTFSVSLDVAKDGRDGEFGINRAQIESGYFHMARNAGRDDVQDEIPPDTVNSREFSKGNWLMLGATNRTVATNASLYGTEGSFQVWRGGQLVVHVYWSIPRMDGRIDNKPFSHDKPTIEIAKSRSEFKAVGALADQLPFASEKDYRIEITGLKPTEVPSLVGKCWATRVNGTIKFKIL